ncbi:MAG: hypothetical protein KDA61_12470, partial [Planctomycetales bacterium]|nr:hypothetical protein [Planctomycetales bacterium]
EELADVDRYLAEKHRDRPDVEPIPDPAGLPGLPLATDAPPLAMLAPGFRTREIPVELPNVNNVLYRDDGTLVALAYNGDVYLLKDRDGDGFEDHAALFWENKGRIRAPIGMDLTPSDSPHGRGVLIASKLQCLLVSDRDGDDEAESTTVIAEGWPESFQGIDACGIAWDRRDSSVYFGIGTQNFADAYDRDENDRPKFRLDGQRGVIQRISPDFKSRTTVATGVRFSIALRFNERGDLFCTDQEGATWLPNGNPFDELLHIDLQNKRHYGFPPRHPKYMPDVIDEPSVFDYGPQHQSTCGLNFNVASPRGSTF